MKHTMSIVDEEKRRDWIKGRMMDCAKNPALSETQHRALAIIAEYRHQIHCGKQQFFLDTDLKEKYIRFLTKTMPLMLRQAGLPPMPAFDELRLSWMPTAKMAKEIGLEGEYYDLALGTCVAEAERINEDIERYLRLIDEKYGTCYAPSGMLRRYKAAV